MRPLVGITCVVDAERHWLPRAYIQAVAGAGGAPVLLPAVTDQDLLQPYCASLHALVLAGGGDVDPWYFREEPRGTREVAPERDAFELELVRDWLTTTKPLLAICRGMQVLNIAAGGDIFQDLPAQRPGGIDHSQQAPRWHAGHGLEVTAGTRLAMVAGRNYRVNSFHHQAVRRVASSLRASAYAPDGVVEAIEGVGAQWVLGVQWHPECLVDRQPEAQQLFQQLVQQAIAKGVEHASID